MSPPGRPAWTRPRPAPVLLVTVALTLLYATGCLHRPPGGHWDTPLRRRALQPALPGRVPRPAPRPPSGSGFRTHRLVRPGRRAGAGAPSATSCGCCPPGRQRHRCSRRRPPSGWRWSATRSSTCRWSCSSGSGCRASTPACGSTASSALWAPRRGRGLPVGPYLCPTAGAGRRPDQRLPVTGVLLLAVLVAVGSILGVRMDGTLCRSSCPWSWCSAEIVFFARMVQVTYLAGGPTELGWLVGICFAAVAAPGAELRPGRDAERSRVGLRLLAVPLVCNGASLFVLAAGWAGRCRRRPPGWPSPAWSPGSSASRYLPRGAGLPPGQGGGPDRRADRAGQPPCPARRGGADGRPPHRPAAPPRCSCWTSTGSRRSTTASATPRRRPAPADGPAAARRRCGG